MKSLREIYRIGKGPSSSHTMGPQKAAQIYLQAHPTVTDFHVTLYGSLAATGKGHMTDVAIEEVLGRAGHVDIEWKPDIFLPFHPNGLKINDWTVYSIGGGALSEGDHPTGLLPESHEVYDLHYLADIKNWCEDHGCAYWEYVKRCEQPDIWDYLLTVWHAMKQSVERGVNHEGRLPGPLNLQRKAPTYFVKAKGYKPTLQTRGLVYAYALAVSEENASGGTIVTAPTCGSCGVVPAVLKYYKDARGYTDRQILDALAAGGIVGALVKTNASVSGAECGCQAEIGTACAMAAAALAELVGMGVDQIEYSAEIAIEHHLGLTCDPIYGLVQIPCIERNAVAAMRAINAVTLANFLTHTRKISLDLVIKTMYNTGRDLNRRYRETADGGLAKLYLKPKEPVRKESE